MLGWQRDRRVPDTAALPHSGLNGLPVNGVPKAAQDGEHVRQGGAVAEEIGQRLTLADELRAPPRFLPAGVTLLPLDCEQDMNEAGGGIDRSHEHDKNGVQFHEDRPDGVSLLGPS